MKAKYIMPLAAGALAVALTLPSDSNAGGRKYWYGEKNGVEGVYVEVKEGDTLSKLSKWFYGDALRFPDVADTNELPDPDKIHPGEVLFFPYSSELEKMEIGGIEHGLGDIEHRLKDVYQELGTLGSNVDSLEQAIEKMMSKYDTGGVGTKEDTTKVVYVIPAERETEKGKEHGYVFLLGTVNGEGGKDGYGKAALGITDGIELTAESGTLEGQPARLQGHFELAEKDGFKVDAIAGLRADNIDLNWGRMKNGIYPVNGDRTDRTGRKELIQNVNGGVTLGLGVRYEGNGFELGAEAGINAKKNIGTSYEVGREWDQLKLNGAVDVPAGMKFIGEAWFNPNTGELDFGYGGLEIEKQYGNIFFGATVTISQGGKKVIPSVGAGFKF